MADTRRDKRAPVALKVRFKSATVEEFLEQYSRDVSRGGMFIKSSRPMSVGALLKFELQLKDESSLIHGVGRVVWVRQPADADDESPAGMGIKFIKMGPESRALVEQIVTSRDEQAGAFEAVERPPTQATESFFPPVQPQDLPRPEDRTQIRHASEFLASALTDADEEAVAEAQANAERARLRTEEIEKEREAARAARQVSESFTRRAVESSLTREPFDEPIAVEQIPPEGFQEGEALQEASSVPFAEVGLPPAPLMKSATAAKVAGVILTLVAVAAVVFFSIRQGLFSFGRGYETDPASRGLSSDHVPSALSGSVGASSSSPSSPESHDRLEAESEVIVSVSSVPSGAEVRVGGERIGTTPIELRASPGEEPVVTVKAPGYVAATRTVSISQGMSPVEFILEPLPYVLEVSTTPPEARVSAEGRSVIAPGSLHLGQGSAPIEVRAVLPGYQPAYVTLTRKMFDENDGALRYSLSLRLAKRSASLQSEGRKVGVEKKPPPPSSERPDPSGSPPAPGEGAAEVSSGTVPENPF